MKIYSRKINSSVITYAAWHSDYDILYIQFTAGACWVYHSVPFDVYRQLINSKSIGNYFNKNIRNNDTYFSQRIRSAKKDLIHV